MTTDSERREVARRLRELKDPYWAGGNSSEASMDVMGVESYLRRNGLSSNLADLIDPEPERTCQDVEGGNFFRCSKCGCELMRFADGWKPLYMGEVRYCPNCGARVVEEEK